MTRGNSITTGSLVSNLRRERKAFVEVGARCTAIDKGAKAVRCACGKLRQANRTCGARHIQDLKVRPYGR